MSALKKNKLIALAMALTLVAAPLAACSSSSSDSTGDSTSSTATSTSSETEATTDELSDEVLEFFVGVWRGGVEVTGESVYGNTSGTENMVDVEFFEDGTVTVTPLENHEDLLNDSGTWEATDTDSVTLHMTDGDITLTVTGSTSMTGNPTDFDIDGFDEIAFVLY